MCGEHNVHDSALDYDNTIVKEDVVWGGKEDGKMLFRVVKDGSRALSRMSKDDDKRKQEVRESTKRRQQ